MPKIDASSSKHDVQLQSGPNPLDHDHHDHHDHSSTSTSSHGMLMWLQRLVSRPAQRACRALVDVAEGHEGNSLGQREVQLTCHQG